MAARALAVLVAACVLPAVSHGVQEMLKGDASLPRQLVLAQAQVSRLVEEKGLLVHSYEGQLAKLTQRLQVAEAHDELLRSSSKATNSEKAALAKALRAAEARAERAETGLREAAERAKDKEVKEKEAKEAEDRALKEAKEKAAREAKEKAAAAAAREKAAHESKGVSAVFGHLYNTSKSLSKNATEAVPAALSKAKGIASEVSNAAGWMLEAVKHGFEAQPPTA